jgi:hypothetical protein
MIEKLRPKTKRSFLALWTITFTLGQMAGPALIDWLSGDPVEIRWFTPVIAIPIGLVSGLIMLWIGTSLGKKHKHDEGHGQS